MRKKSCMRYLSRALSRIFCGGGGGEQSIPEKSLEPRSGEKFFLGIVEGPGACSQEKF